MKRIAVVFLLSALRLTAQTTLPTADSATTRTLLALEKQWNEATYTRDTAFLARLLTEDFRFLAPNGQLNTKRDVLKAVLNPDISVDPYVTENVVVRVRCTTAVLTGEFTQVIHFQGKTYRQRYSYTDVYVRESNTWRALSAQATLLKQP